jgi:hypothetical protein
VGAGLSRKEERDQDCEEHHVAGESGKEEEANLVKQFARTVVLMLPVVVASTPSSTGRSMVNGRFAADSRLSPFRFRRGMRKGSGHCQASVQIRLHHFPLDALISEVDGLLV